MVRSHREKRKFRLSAVCWDFENALDNVNNKLPKPERNETPLEIREEKIRMKNNLKTVRTWVFCYLRQGSLLLLLLLLLPYWHVDPKNAGQKNISTKNGESKAARLPEK